MNIQTVQDYYGKTLQSSADLKTSACCTPGNIPASLKAKLANVHPEVLAKYYGCGLIAPASLEGARVLDLGCGAGRDVYVLAQMVGPKGKVVGVDMTPEQLAVAKSHQEWHRERFGYCCSNVEFLEGYIEKLDQLPLEPGSFDVIVSNCVVNLSLDKLAVLKGVFNLLKLGGEFYFADVYADRRLAPHLKDDPVLYGECLAGALYWGDFLRLAKESGFIDPRLVTSRPLEIGSEDVAAKLGAARFFSATYRLFRLDGLEEACEDYGQAVIYRGGCEGMDTFFELDAHHHIERGRVFPVCGNTYRMLKESRFSRFFEFLGDFSTHYGIFPGCGTLMPFEAAAAPGAETSGGCC